MQRIFRKHASDNGFTLIELLICVAIIAILATVAIPAYFSHTMRSRQTRAISELMIIKAAQERYFAEHGSYAGTITILDGYAGAGTSYTNLAYRYWIRADTTGMATTIMALGDLNGDGNRTNDWRVSIQDLNAKPREFAPGNEGFSWSSLADV